MFLHLLDLVLSYYLYHWVRELPRVLDKGGKYVYITGCDSGFGNLPARHLDKQGFRVIAGCFTEKGEEDEEEEGLLQQPDDDTPGRQLQRQCGESGHLDQGHSGGSGMSVTDYRGYKGVDPMDVVRCMEHAVAAVLPRGRYSPGWDDKLFWLPLSYMLSRVQDFILK